jgi:hypothetical protein
MTHRPLQRCLRATLWRQARLTAAGALLATLAATALAWPVSERSPASLGPGYACQSLAGPPLNPSVDWVTDVFPRLESCASCHLTEFPGSRLRIVPGDPELTLVDLLDPADDLVLALRPRDSVLMQRLNCDRLDQQEWRMPRCFLPPCNYWSAVDQAVVWDWIAQGARGDFDGSPLGDIVFVDGIEGARL